MRPIILAILLAISFRVIAIFSLPCLHLREHVGDSDKSSNSPSFFPQGASFRCMLGVLSVFSTWCAGRQQGPNQNPEERWGGRRSK